MNEATRNFLRDLEQVRAIAPKVAPVELRSSGDDDSPGTLTGHFSVFNTWYDINSLWEGRFLERVAPGAFKRTFNAYWDSGDSHRIQVLLEHGYDPTVGDKPLGVPSSLREDRTGAFYEVELFDASYVLDLVPAFSAGVYGASFRFRVLHDEWIEEPGESDHNPHGIPERTIREMRVVEFGPTVFPASPTATAGMRSQTDEFYERLRSREPSTYEQLLARAREIRTPATGPAVDAATSPDANGTPEPGLAPRTEDPPQGHSEVITVHTDKTRSETVDTPMTVEERAARRDEIQSRMAAMADEFDGQEMPEEARNEWDELNTELDTHVRAIRETEERRERVRKFAERSGNREEGSVTPSNVDTGSRSTRTAANIYDLGEIRKIAKSVDDLPELYRQHAKRAIEQGRYSGARSREDAQSQVERLLDEVDDDQGTLARRILVTGSPVYERAFGKAATALSTGGLSPEEARALAVGTDNKGGYAVPFALDPTIILTNDGTINPLRQIARVEQITTKTWQGVTSAGVTVTRAGEAAQVANNDPTLAQPEVTPQRVHGFIPFSIEVDQDWSQMRSEMTRLLQDAKDIEESTSFVTGDGSTGQQPGGIPGSLVAAGSLIYIGSSWDDSDVYGIEEALAPRFRARGSFLANKSTYNTIRQFADADGHDLWERIGRGQPAELLGYGAYEASAMAGDGADGNKFLVFGDFTQFLIVDRVGMSIELVPHLFGADRRPTGQRGLYAIWRNDSAILVPNAFRALVKGDAPSS